MDIFWIMQIIIVIVALVTVFLEIRKIKNLGFHIITFMVILACLFWATYYSYQLVREIFNYSLPAHRVFVRSGILFSLVVFLAKAIRVNRSIMKL